jgi:hypothetical protein
MSQEIFLLSNSRTCPTAQPFGKGPFENLSSVIGRLVDERSSSAPRRRVQPETTALIPVLAGHFVKEYQAFSTSIELLLA